MEEQKENDSNKEEVSAVYSYIILGVVSCFLWYESSIIVEVVLNWVFTVKPGTLDLFIILPITLLFALVVIVTVYLGIGIGIDCIFKRNKSSQNTYYLVLCMFLLFTAFIYVYNIWYYFMKGAD